MISSEEEKLCHDRTKNRTLCPTCGHSILFDKNKQEKVICRWCNKYVFRNKKAEFEWRLKESINRKK